MIPRMAPSPATSTARAAARIEAFELIHRMQAGDPGAEGELARLSTAAADADWGEVVRIAMFGDAVAQWLQRGAQLSRAIDRLHTRCVADGDTVMTALALSMRSDRGGVGDDPILAAAADADLAKAAVMLENASGGALERVSAHTACGIAFGNRWLWELADEQYGAALALGDAEPAGTLDQVLAPVVYNRAEAQISWASTLRQLGDVDQVAVRRRAWEVATAAAGAYAVPESWQLELDTLDVLLSAIAGDDRGGDARAMLAASAGREVGPRAAGHLQLAIALSDAGAGRRGAAASSEAAVELVDPRAHPHEFDLALHVAAEVEAAAGHGAGLRSSKRQFAERWAGRLATLGSMQARLSAERLAAEHDTLRRYAHLDDLTGVANRRALERYAQDLAGRGTASVAFVLLDVDGFKAVNDRHGHAAGDEALVRLARVLERDVRLDDLVVRLGGDEFAVVLPDTGLDAACERAERVVHELGEQPWTELDGEFSLSVSAGVAAGHPSDLEAISSRADAALYEAKAAGGRRIVRHDAS